MSEIRDYDAWKLASPYDLEGTDCPGEECNGCYECCPPEQDEWPEEEEPDYDADED